MRKPQGFKGFKEFTEIFQSLTAPQRGRDIYSVVAFLMRLAVTSGAFAFCGWIAAGKWGAIIFGTAVFALLTQQPASGRNR